MPRICYENKKFQGKSLDIIRQANSIIKGYAAQGFDLTLRQLYYQFVARDVIPNNLKEYKRLSTIVNDARYAGLIDWLHITDRTRSLRSNSHWDGPEDIISSAVSSFAIDKWAMQEYRPEVWIEKDALVGVIEGACRKADVSYFSCRGYTSASEMWIAAQRLVSYLRNGQTPLVIHLGDHDPSGMDMSRDIFDRLELFIETEGYKAAEVKRIALNMDQIETYRPPPNFAKLTDTRANSYIQRYGGNSWELDALEPTVLAGLIESTVAAYRDDHLWEEAVTLERQHRENLRGAARRWGDVTRYLKGGAE